jgi:predicted unusual protein kinase regulating ubiquinone biosynthesis (AarF/ABC1/UbiB family)
MERFLNTSLEFGIRIPHDFVLVSKAITTFEGTCLSLDPEIRIVDHLRRFVQKHITAPPHGDDVLKQLLAVPFETARLKRLVLKHGGNLFRFLEQPTVRLARDAADTRSDERAGMNIVYGLLMAALIIFAAVIGGESGLERWLRSLFALPDLPVLPLAGLTCAGVLGLAMALRNRRARRGRQ